MTNKEIVLGISLAMIGSTHATQLLIDSAITSGNHTLLVKSQTILSGVLGDNTYVSQQEQNGVAIPIIVDSTGGILRGSLAYEGNGTINSGTIGSSNYITITHHTDTSDTEIATAIIQNPWGDTTDWAVEIPRFAYQIPPNSTGYIFISESMWGYLDAINYYFHGQGEFYNLQVGGSCPMLPLAPILDPLSQSFEAGNEKRLDLSTTKTQTAYQCLNNVAAQNGCTISLVSAFRPVPYQSHLREVWDDHFNSEYRSLPGCKNLYSIVDKEFKRHKLSFGKKKENGSGSNRPATSSPHTRGQAVDINWTLSAGQTIDDLADQCGLERIVDGDTTHFTLEK